MYENPTQTYDPEIHEYISYVTHPFPAKNELSELFVNHNVWHIQLIIFNT